MPDNGGVIAVDLLGVATALPLPVFEVVALLGDDTNGEIGEDDFSTTTEGGGGSVG